MPLSTHRKRFLATLLLTVLAVLLAGCGGDDSSGEERSNGTATADDGDAAAGGAASEAATVEMTELTFTPAEVTITSGGTIQATNAGATPHNLVIEQGPDPATPTTELAATEDVPAGDSAELTVDLDPGTYALVCTIPGHREGGMTGTITVQ